MIHDPVPQYCKIIFGPVEILTEISRGPVEPTVKITDGPVQLRDENNRWSRCKFPGPVMP